MSSYYATLSQWGEVSVHRADDAAPVAGELVDDEAGTEAMRAAATRWLECAEYRLAGGWREDGDGDGWRVDVDLVA